MEKKQKFLLGFFIFLILLIAGELFYYTYLKKRISAPKIEEKPAVSQKLTHLQIAKKVLDCLDKTMRDERDVFFIGKECPSLSCQDLSQDNRGGLSVLWGYTICADKLKDINLKKILLKDIDNYLNDEKVRVIQPIFWSKKFLFDIWKTNILSDQEKEKIKQLNSKLLPGDFALLGKIFGLIKKENYKPSSLELIYKKGKVFSRSINEPDFQTQVAFALDYLSEFLWQGREESRRIADELFYQSTKDYLESNQMTVENKCLFGLTTSEFYQATDEKIYKDLALGVSEDILKEKPCFTEGNCASFVRPPIMCAMFFKKLYQITGVAEYNLLQKSIINNLIQLNFDDLNFSGSYVNDGCFFDRLTTTKSRMTVDNAMVAGFLCNED